MLAAAFVDEGDGDIYDDDSVLMLATIFSADDCHLL